MTTKAEREAAYQALVKRGVPIPPNEIDAVLEAAEGARGVPPERIVRAAIKWGKAVYSVPAPGRHGDVFRVIEADPMADMTCDGGPDAQGFLTSTGRFLGRVGAKQCARDAGQLLPTASKSTDLFSEDLW